MVAVKVLREGENLKMASITRLTNNSDETDIASLISKDNIFSIPFFQRPYKWKADKVTQFQKDILALVDESTDFHFLGAFIVHGRRTNPSDPDLFDVIDGQQRLTTIYLLLCATVKVLTELKEYDEAAALFQKYVAINRNLPNLSNSRLHSCKQDRAQLNAVIKDVLSDKALRDRLGSFKYKELAVVANTSEQGPLRKNYGLMFRFLRAENDEGGIDRIRAIYSCLLNKVTIVQIDIKDPASGPTIFDSLNSKQEPMTIGDLVRNGLFSRVADQEPDEIETIDREAWQPFYGRFEFEGKNYFDAFFFPYGLIRNPNLRKTDIYNFLQRQWLDVDDPVEIINQLNEYQSAFMDLMCGTNTMQHDKIVARSIRRLFSLGLPGSTLPFLMRLSRECKVNGIDPNTALEVLEVVESFLVRRALCGIEPTGLHAVFKGLWQATEKNFTAEDVKRQITSHKTVAWPTDAELSENILERSLYGSGIAPFILIEYDKSLGGDHPGETPWIEHVLPQIPDAEWWDHFDKEFHAARKDTLANLIPLSVEMNRKLSNSAYLVKVDKYKSDSMYKSARAFADTFPIWNPENFSERTASLQKWAQKRWPHNATKS